MTRKVVHYLGRHHVGLVALFVALSGTAYAASLPRNSVGTVQLKRDAVTSAKVKNRSLLARDFRRGQLPAGPTGPRGAAGPAGDGINRVVERRSPVATAGAGEIGVALARCGAGERATGGGFVVVGGGGVANLATDFRVWTNGPAHSDPASGAPVQEAWELKFFHAGSGGSLEAQAAVLCAS